MSKTCLVVMYNHHFPKNVAVLDSIYGDRFSRILHLMPLSSSEDTHLRSVARSSHHFQGYFFDAREALVKADCDRYLFIADDVFLNPNVDEENLEECFGLDSPNDSFIHLLDSFENLQSYWSHASKALGFRLATPALNLSHALPSKDAARKKLEAHAVFSEVIPRAALYASRRHLLHNFLSTLAGHIDSWIQDLLKIPRRTAPGSFSNKLSYPLAYGYSDIFIISGGNLTNFIDACGAFAAAGLFVEVALPTALAITSQRIATQENSPMKGELLWGSDKQKLDRFDWDLAKLATEFPDNLLFVHPVKLSSWNRK